MSKFLHPDALDNGPALIKSAANQMHLVKAYSLADTYATVLGNSLCNAAMTTADYTLAAGAANARTLTTAAGKTSTATAASGATPDLHIAFLDTTGLRVLWVTDETTDQSLIIGNGITFPAVVLTSSQPT